MASRLSLRVSACLLFLGLMLVAGVSSAEANASGPKTYRPNGGEGSVKSEECPGKCSYRCSATSHRQYCMEFCIKCCSKCLCVPSGTYGHKEECPCYDNWKTKEGKPKCP